MRVFFPDIDDIDESLKSTLPRNKKCRKYYSPTTIYTNYNCVDTFCHFVLLKFPKNTFPFKFFWGGQLPIRG